MPSYTTNSGEVVSRFLSRMSASKGCASAFRVFAKETYGTPRESNAQNMNNKIPKGASCTEMRVLGLKISLGTRVMSMVKYWQFWWLLGWLAAEPHLFKNVQHSMVNILAMQEHASRASSRYRWCWHIYTSEKFGVWSCCSMLQSRLFEYLVQPFSRLLRKASNISLWKLSWTKQSYPLICHSQVSSGNTHKP